MKISTRLLAAVLLGIALEVVAQRSGTSDQLRFKVLRLAALMDAAKADVLAFMTFPEDNAAPMWSASSPTRKPSPAS